MYENIFFILFTLLSKLIYLQLY